MSPSGAGRCALPQSGQGRDGRASVAGFRERTAEDLDAHDAPIYLPRCARVADRWFLRGVALKNTVRHHCAMWYDKLGIVSIGVQSGGPEDGGLGDIKIDLWRLFCRHCQSSYCATIAHYALALRIGGEFVEFSPEGIEKIRLSRRDRFVGADIVIPQAVWRDSTRNELRDYLARQVRAALQSCVARLRKDKETVDEARLFGEIDAAIGEFTQIDYDRHA